MRGPADGVKLDVAADSALPDRGKRRAAEQARHRQARDDRRRKQRLHVDLDARELRVASKERGMECVCFSFSLSRAMAAADLAFAWRAAGGVMVWEFPDAASAWITAVRASSWPV